VAEVLPVQPVQVIAAVLVADLALLPEVERDLERVLSPIEASSEPLDFDCTGYYGPEMGSGLKRVLYAFRDLASPETIVDIKLATNKVEEYYADSGKRRVNIDPGYLDFHKLVLASAKFLGQKIYMGKGIYADPTLYYDKGWKPHPWGFPDFKDGRSNGFLAEVRAAYKAKLRRIGDGRATEREAGG
jgi:hypothetical protein